jgi:hypothetical protein
VTLDLVALVRTSMALTPVDDAHADAKQVVPAVELKLLPDAK